MASHVRTFKNTDIRLHGKTQIHYVCFLSTLEVLVTKLKNGDVFRSAMTRKTE